jgi:hypothetical protein
MLEAAAAVLEDSRESFIRSSTREGASAPSWTDDGAATVMVVREPQSSPLHPIQVLLRRRLLTLALVFAPVAGLTTIVFSGWACSRHFAKVLELDLLCGLAWRCTQPSS